MNILEAALAERETDYSIDDCKEKINEQVKKEIVSLSQRIKLKHKEESKIHKDYDKPPSKIRKPFFDALLAIFQEEFDR